MHLSIYFKTVAVDILLTFAGLVSMRDQRTPAKTSNRLRLVNFFFFFFMRDVVIPHYNYSSPSFSLYLSITLY